MRHEKSRVVGKHPDTGADIIETETYFTYEKGWKPYLISSLFFNNKVTYFNPMRDPFPSYAASVPTLVSGNYEIDGAALINALHDGLQYHPVRLSQRDLDNVHLDAKKQGFKHATDRWFVSKYELSLLADIAKKAASYLVEGTVDLGGWFESCTAGDIRGSYLLFIVYSFSS
jgi:hypothetical protein